MVEHVLTFRDQNGNRVAGILATPEIPTARAVLLCHGFLSGKNSTTNKALTRLLTAQGIATLRFDFFGHGDSEGLFEDLTVTVALDQALSALDVLAAQGHTRVGLVGSSFGGFVAILVAARRADLACLGLKCPVVDFAEVLRLEFGQAGMDHWRTHHEIPDLTGGLAPLRLRFSLYDSCLDYDGYQAASQVTIPTLIVQGGKDELVPLHQSSRLVEALPGQRVLEILPGADHTFSQAEDFRRMTTLLSDWMVRHLA
jgi:pimeloyl-ACP methyl ester carboxylesterase